MQWPMNQEINKTTITVIITCVTILCGVSACATTPQPASEIAASGAFEPAAIDTGRLAPGLSVRYLYGLNMRHIDQLPTPEETAERGKPGKPIPYLDHKFGSRNVFDSGTNRKIALQMEGFLHLSEPGPYRFKANANDGIRIFIGGQRIVDDPDVHSDRFSEEGVFTAAEAGWFPVLVRYFQRKATATLQFFWQPPRADTFTIVPAEAYAHLPDE